MPARSGGDNPVSGFCLRPADSTPTGSSEREQLQLDGELVLCRQSLRIDPTVRGLDTLLTGLVQSLGTTWGVLRHDWVVAKLLIAVVATTILLLHTQAIKHVAEAAAQTVLSTDDLRQLRIQLVADAGAALLALLVATGLSVYKPGGLTAYGRRKKDEERPPSQPAPRDSRTPRWVYASGIVAVGLVLLFIILHLTGRGLGGP